MYLLWLLFGLILNSNISYGKSLSAVFENELTDLAQTSNDSLVNKIPTNKIKIPIERKFKICEQFNETKETKSFNLHGNGITILTRLES